MLNNIKIDYFYFFGITIILSSLNFLFLDLTQDQFKWTFYILILVLGISISFFNFFHKKFYSFKISNIFFFITLLYFIYLNHDLNLINFILIINSIFIVYYLNDYKISNIINYKNLKNITYFFILFSIAIRLYYWIDFDEYLWRNIEENTNRFNLIYGRLENYFLILPTIIKNNFTFIQIFNFIFLIFFIIFYVIINFLNIKSTEYNSKFNFFLKYFWWLIPLLIFFLESFSTYNFFSKIGGGALHHWQAYIATLEMLSNGGYILWDTPSQYGFLSLLTIYIMPFENLWLKLYFLNSSLNLFASMMIFYVIWNKNNFYWYVISFLLTFSIFFILSDGPNFDNISSTPSSGPLRYFWIIFMSFLIVILKNKSFIFQLKFILPFWIIGFFWSVLSAFCVSIIIIPYLLYYLFYDKIFFRKRILYILSFPLSIFLFCILISFYYFVKINNFPDFYAFFEYAIQFNSVFVFIEEFNLNGSILLPIFILSWMIICIYTEKNIQKKYLSFCIFLSIWSVSIYTISWMDNSVFLRFIILYIYFLFLFIKLLEKKISSVFSFCPIYISIIIFCFTNPKTFYHLDNTIKNQNYDVSNISIEENNDYHKILTKINPQKIPVAYIEPGRYQFFNSKSSYINLNTNKKIKIKRNLLPVFFAAVILAPLNERRRYLYGQRWLQRNYQMTEGWFISSKTNPWHTPYKKLTNKILKNYKIKKRIIYNDLEAVLYVKE